MSSHLDYLLDLPGVKVETCTQIEGKIYFKLSALAPEIVCPHCNNYTEELHQNQPILVRDLSAFGRFVYLQGPRRQFYCRSCQRYTKKLEFVDKKKTAYSTIRTKYLCTCSTVKYVTNWARIRIEL
jgi:transposase